MTRANFGECILIVRDIRWAEVRELTLTGELSLRTLATDGGLAVVFSEAEVAVSPTGATGVGGGSEASASRFRRICSACSSFDLTFNSSTLRPFLINGNECGGNNRFVRLGSLSYTSVRTLSYTPNHG